jgi:hypothetical protein
MSFSRMFILLGMLAVAALVLLLLLERWDSGVFHEVHTHGRLHYTPVLIPPSFCEFI